MSWIRIRKKMSILQRSINNANLSHLLVLTTVVFRYHKEKSHCLTGLYQISLLLHQPWVSMTVEIIKEKL